MCSFSRIQPTSPSTKYRKLQDMRHRYGIHCIYYYYFFFFFFFFPSDSSVIGTRSASTVAERAESRVSSQIWVTRREAKRENPNSFLGVKLGSMHITKLEECHSQVVHAAGDVWVVSRQHTLA